MKDYGLISDNTYAIDVQGYMELPLAPDLWEVYTTPLRLAFEFKHYDSGLEIDSCSIEEKNEFRQWKYRKDLQPFADLFMKCMSKDQIEAFEAVVFEEFKKEIPRLKAEVAA